MLHSVPAVYSTATSRPQTLTSRRRSFSRMNLDSEPKKICVILEAAQNRTPFRGPHQLYVPDALPGSGTPRSGTLLSSRETSTTLPESMANSSKTVLIEAGNVTIVLHCCRASKPPSGTVQPGVFGSDRWRTV
ncbi:uncharacterized protein LOC119768846 [Culex quinquefasciatus]|uniref:uncharacterized protein LOC119768846 n=1 Tax=Culex quinquefasciatus TaxID=7176 RepID=UPI0018E2A7C4|nr:uncharacterized protein LOC119768846 [Culex quinquefasciatus]XP_038116212.1 uncharacterized protein LOC119768846 [Culex quinquefasciatus]XP_038116213.1 uncharacterized protein LOC119768846 [Culex quinquefasciatus]